jgi:hypothetical protein
MSPEEYVTNLILNLGEVETLELLQVIGSTNDPPPFEKGEFHPLEVQEWVRRNQESIVPSLLRVVDLGDEAVAYLHRLGVLFIGRTYWEGSLLIKFPRSARFTVNSSAESDQAFALSDLAATSAALCELFAAIGTANHSFGLSVEAPQVVVQNGSIQYLVAGSLLAAGVGLVIACAEGAVLGPYGFIGGGVLASAGLIDLALGWRKAVRESSKFESEAHKLEAEAQKLVAEASKLHAEARKLTIEAEVIKGKRFDEPNYQYRNFAHSNLIPREIVLREAEKLGLNEGYANHVINRALPKFALIEQRFHEITSSSKDE